MKQKRILSKMKGKSIGKMISSPEVGKSKQEKWNLLDKEEKILNSFKIKYKLRREETPERKLLHKAQEKKSLIPIAEEWRKRLMSVYKVRPDIKSNYFSAPLSNTNVSILYWKGRWFLDGREKTKSQKKKL